MSTPPETGMLSPRRRSGIPGVVKVSTTISISPRESPMGLPVFFDSSCARFSFSASRASARRPIYASGPAGSTSLHFGASSRGPPRRRRLPRSPVRAYQPPLRWRGSGPRASRDPPRLGLCELALSSSSGARSTPSTNGQLGSSSASTASSSAAQPVTSRPLPTSFMPWWCDLGSSHLGAGGAGGERAGCQAPRGRRTPGVWRCSSWPSTSGVARCCRRIRRSGPPSCGRCRGWHAAADGGARQSELVGVALVLYRTGLGVRLLAIEGRGSRPPPRR